MSMQSRVDNLQKVSNQLKHHYVDLSHVRPEVWVYLLEAGIEVLHEDQWRMLWTSYKETPDCYCCRDTKTAIFPHPVCENAQNAQEKTTQ